MAERLEQLPLNKAFAGSIPTRDHLLLNISMHLKKYEMFEKSYKNVIVDCRRYEIK